MAGRNFFPLDPEFSRCGRCGAEERRTSVQPVVCPEDVIADRCGYVRVPIDRSRPGGKQIDIFVAVKEALSSLSKAEPVFYLAGGSGLSSDPFIDPISKYIITDRDVVGIDYWGGGYSLPRLDCRAKTVAEIRISSSWWRQQSIPLHLFNTVQAAQDVETVRISLGYKKINLYGSSYGTLWAQEVTRRSPDLLRSVVLSGVIPKGLNYFEELTPALEQVTRQILIECRRDNFCNKTYPNLPERFERGFSRLSTRDKAGVASLINLIGGDSKDLGAIPKVMDDALSRKPLPPRTSFSVPSTDTATGLNVVGNCQEHIAFTTPEKLRAVHKKTSMFTGMDNYNECFEMCDALGRERVDGKFLDPVRVNVPTLLLGGEFDSRTPVVWMNQMASLPSKWQRVVLKGEGHLPDWSACGTQIIQDFLRRPSVRPVRNCAAEGKLSFR